jgi:ankyrin repeat protein
VEAKAKALLALGADKEDKEDRMTSRGETPLHAAAVNGHVTAMKALLALGAVKEAKDCRSADAAAVGVGGDEQGCRRPDERAGTVRHGGSVCAE